MIEPALREKKRYVIIKTNKKVDFNQLKENIYKELIAFLGVKGTGEMNLLILPELWREDKGVIKVKHDKVNELKFVLGLITNFKTKTIKTTGSLTKAKRLLEGK